MFKFWKKTALAAGTAAAVIALSGCSGKIPFTDRRLDFNKSYTVCAEIDCDRLKAKADVTRAAAQDWQFVFTEPKELKGMTLSYNSGVLSGALGELSFSADDNTQYAMLPEIIASSVDMLSAIPTESLLKEDGAVVAEPTFDGEKVTVTMDEKTGNLVSLKCPHYQLAVTFSDQKPYVPAPADTGSTTSSETSM